MKALIEDIASGQRFVLNKDIFKYPPVNGDIIRFTGEDNLIYVYIITNKFICYVMKLFFMDMRNFCNINIKLTYNKTWK